MITKKSSNDEVIHHLKQMELMLLTDEEEKGLKNLLEVEKLIKAPDVAYWLEDGIASEVWGNETRNLIDEVKKKLLKDYIIKEHISQCKGFIAYHILLSKAQDATVEVVYQNGEWLFSVVNSRGEAVAWVNQRFNNYFFNTSYERKFIEIIKEHHMVKVDKPWLFKREDWFYSSDLFISLKELLKQKSFQEIAKSQEKPIKDYEVLPPLPEDDFEEGLSIGIKENIVVSSSDEILDDVRNHDGDIEFEEEMPPIPDEDYGLFGTKVETVMLQPVITEKVIESVPREVEFTFDNDVPHFEDGFKPASNEYSYPSEQKTELAENSYIPSLNTEKVINTSLPPKVTGRFDNKVKFAKRPNASSGGVMVPGPAPVPVPGQKSKGFAPIVNGSFLSEVDECPFGDAPNED